MSTSQGWETQPNCPHKYVSNPIQCNVGEFVVAPYSSSKEFQQTADCLQIYSTQENKWKNWIKYPKKLKSTNHHICNNFNDEIFMYGAESSAIFCYISESKWKVKKGHIKVMPGAQIIYYNGTYHIIGGNYNTKHYQWNSKKSKFIPIYQFKDWHSFGMKDYGLIACSDMFLFGGYSSKHLTPSNKIYQFTSNTWKLLDTKMPKSQPMSGFGCVCYANKVFIFGGLFFTSVSDEIWILDLSTKQWNKSQIKCPVEDKFYAVIPKSTFNIHKSKLSNYTNVSIHLLSRTNGKHWKISMDEIMNSTQQMNSQMHDDDHEQKEEKKCDREANNSDKSLLIYLDNAIKDMSKIIEILNENNGVVCSETSDIQNKMQILKDQFHSIEKMSHVDINNYQKWGTKQIVAYIGQIENGRFIAYMDNIQKFLSAMNIASGAELPEISSFMLQKFGIENNNDRNDLIKYFVSLKVGGNINAVNVNYVPSAPSAVYQDFMAENDENEETQVEGRHAETVGKDIHT